METTHVIVTSHTVDCTKDGDTRRASIDSSMRCVRCKTVLTQENAENYGVLHLSVALGRSLGL